MQFVTAKLGEEIFSILVHGTGSCVLVSRHTVFFQMTIPLKDFYVHTIRRLAIIIILHSKIGKMTRA